MKRTSFLALLTLTGALLACGDRGQPGPDLEELPLGEFELLPAAAREAVSESKTRLAGLLEDPQVSQAELGNGWGELGRICHALKLEKAAEVCYEQAVYLNPGDFRWPYLQGYLYQGQGRFDEAALSFAAVLEIRPDDLATLYRLGEVELDRDRPQEAAALFRRALGSPPSPPAAHYGLGRALLALGEVETAIVHLETALAAQPDSNRIHHPLGLAYRQAGDLERARHHLALRGETPVAIADPLVVELLSLAGGSGRLVRMGLEASKVGDAGAARRRFGEAVEADPENLMARYNLAVSLGKAGEIESAIEEYKAILNLDPDNSSALANLGDLLARQGNLDQAIEYYREALVIAPDFKQVRFNLALALSRKGLWDQALAEYEEVSRIDPEFASVRFRRAMAMIRAGRAEEGLQALEALLATEPGHLEARIAIAAVLRDQGRSQAALLVLDEGLAAADADPRRARFELEIAKILSRSAPVSAALEHADRARRLDPGLMEASLVRGQLLMLAGQFGPAADDLAEFVSHRPNYVPARVAEAEALRRAGRQAEVRARLQAGLEKLPQSSRLALALARHLATCPDDQLRDGERALALVEPLADRIPSSAAVETLAMAQAELGRFEEAAETQQRLISQLEGRAGPDLLRRLKQNLESYRRDSPARSQPLLGWGLGDAS